MGLLGTVLKKIEKKKQTKELQDQMDRDDVRCNPKTLAITEAIRKQFLPNGIYFRKLCDPNVRLFWIEVVKWGIIAKTIYFKKVGESDFHSEVMIRFCDIALNDLKSGAMKKELRVVLLEELGKVPRIRVDDLGYISLMKDEW